MPLAHLLHLPPPLILLMPWAPVLPDATGATGAAADNDVADDVDAVGA